MRLLPLLLLALLFFVGGTKAATHVNISIGQQPIKNPTDVTYVDAKSAAALRVEPSNERHRSDFSYLSESENNNNNFRAAKLRNFEYSQGSARLVAADDKVRLESSGGQSFGQQQQQHQHGYKLRGNEQDKQNQEFERYIQNYHSGPTVETVFESATPSSQRQQKYSSSTSSSSFSSSSSNGSPARQPQAFERQVALPSPAPTAALLPPSDDRQTHTIVNHQPKSSSGGSEQALSSSGSSSSGGYDQSSFDQDATSYNKPSYDQNSYSGGYDDSDLNNQFPPSIDESQSDFRGHSSSGGGGGFYNGGDQSNFYGGSTPAPGYLPSYPRPVVTKTIQIAQPALKAKKYEIRHPAVQKEFYDIEERVVIKPAGTIVVELERPVAKIPKGETILPLGHPHPAVASAYNTNGAAIVQTMGSNVVSNSGGSNQYSPSPVYNPTGSGATETQHTQHPAISSTTIASTLTTTPTYDLTSKDEFVETNLNKQYNGDAQYITTTERSYPEEKQGNDGFYVTTTESNRNFGPQFYSRDETDRRYPGHVAQVEVKNNGAPSVSTSYAGNQPQTSFSAGGQSNYKPLTAQFQPNYNDKNQFKGEFFGGDFYNHQKGPKPARLQEQPRTVTDDLRTPATHIVKHEHNIHLPPSQHNIYLGRLEQESALNARSQQSAQIQSGPRYNAEAARVLEIKPFLKHHPGSVVVYASTTVRPALSNDAVRYAQSQPRQQRIYAAPNKVHYSAPYSNMRYDPDQSSRYVYDNEPINHKNDNNADFLPESSSEGAGYQSDAPFKTASNQPHAHIHIQIPHHPQESDKPIVVSSTISPPVKNVHDERTANYRQPASYYGGNDEERFSPRRQQEYGFDRSANLESTKPDCDQIDALGDHSASYKEPRGRQKFLRLIESPTSDSGSLTSTSNQNVANLQPGSVDVNLKSTAGHVATPGSRVIAATPAPTDAAAASESFHKRRIVVNHPFQTVREVVEHEPITNYHHVQVNEPASPELYHHTAPYYQQETHGALRQVETVPVLYHHHSASTHGNLHYAPVVPVVHGVTLGYHHHV